MTLGKQQKKKKIRLRYKKNESDDEEVDDEEAWLTGEIARVNLIKVSNLR